VRLSRGFAALERLCPAAHAYGGRHGKGIKQAAAEEKVTGPIEMSDLRPTDHGPGHFVVCIRGVDEKYRRVGYYAVFFDNDDYKGSRMSVMIDDCEKQDYRPFVPVGEPEKSVGPKPRS